MRSGAVDRHRAGRRASRRRRGSATRIGISGTGVVVARTRIAEERPFCAPSSEMLDAFALGRNCASRSRNRSRISADCIAKCVFAFAPRANGRTVGRAKGQGNMRGRGIKPTAGRPASNGVDTLVILFDGPSDACAERHQKTVSCDTDGSGATGPSSNGRLHLTAGKQRGREDD
jgi:hypothetical protein